MRKYFGLAAMAYGLAWTGSALAGGPVIATWDQAGDCASVTGWEVLAAPVTLAQPNPGASAATIRASLANTPPAICGMSVNTTLPVEGVGPMRFWVRAVGGPLRSGESNAVDVSLPLARPAGLTIVVP